MLEEVTKAYRDYLWSQKAIIDEAFVDEGMTLAEIFQYDKTTIETGEFPCLVLENPMDDSTWLAAPFLAEWRMEIPITGFVVHDDQETCNKLVKRFAHKVQRALALIPGLQLATDLLNAGQTVHVTAGPNDTPMPHYQISFQQVDEKAFLHIFEGTIIGVIDGTPGAIL